jgi:hypothetical protein
MVQIPTFTSKTSPQRISGVISQIPNITDAATLPYRTLSSQADNITNLALKFKQQNKDFDNQLYKLNKEQEIKEYTINEEYKTNVINAGNKLASDFQILQLRLDRKTLLKSTVNNLLPQLNEIKLTASTNSDTLKAKEQYDTSWKQIVENAKLNIDDKVVKQMFDMEMSDLYAKESQQVDSFIRKNSINNAKLVLDTEKENLFHDYFTYPDQRPVILQKLFSLDPEAPGIFMEAAMDGILEVPPQIAVQGAQVELFTIEAEKLVEENPKDFLSKLEDGYWKGKILATNIPKLKDAAIDKAREMDIDFLVTHMPVDPNMDIDVAEELYNQAISGDFGGDEIKQSIYQNLDNEGKTDFTTAINQQRSHVRAEISFQQGQEQQKEINANNELYTDTFEKITLGELNISDIDNIEFQGKLGTQYKTLLKDLIAKREQNLLPTDQNLELHDKIFKKIMNGEIQSLTDQVIMHNGERKSILELTGGENGLGTNQTQDFYNLIANKNNTDVLLTARYFEEFVAANKENILGNAAFAKLNLKAEPRFFQFKLIMKQRFEEGLKEGKNVFQLLDKTSEHYILKDILTYIPTKEQQTREVKESMTFKDPEENIDNTMPQIGPDEDWDDFIKSDRYLKWKANQ